MLYNFINKLLISLSIFVFLLSACANKKDLDLNKINFLSGEKVGFKLKSYRVINLYDPLKSDIGYMLPEGFLDTTLRWAENKFYIEGQEGKLILKVIEASISEKNLKIREGIKDIFFIDQDLEISIKLKIRLEVYGNENNLIASVQSYSKTNFSLPERITLNEKKRQIYEAKKKVFSDLEKSLFKEIKIKLSKYLV